MWHSSMMQNSDFEFYPEAETSKPVGKKQAISVHWSGPKLCPSHL